MSDFISNTCYEIGGEINKSYQTSNRVDSYIVTQDYVVSKKQFLEKVIQVILEKGHQAKQRKQISFLEPGMGPAVFCKHLFMQSFADSFQKVHYYGADISRAMIDYASSKITSYTEKHIFEKQKYRFFLASGVNCINHKETFYSEILNKGIKFDVIICSQFEHYCPNSIDSPLALKLKNKGISFVTKREIREFYFSLLSKGGLYFTIDDRFGENAKEHEELCDAWDSHVANQFTNEAILSEIEEVNPSLARNLRINYDPRKNVKELQRVAAKFREHRRDVSNEEIETFSQSLSDFIEIYGEENVFSMPHPNSETHPGFYLIWAQKN